ncbi:cell division protein FtsX [Candidatus Odyssella thessalonicensis]|uniref:cell division protein FtsX n=1 Tax=Candidatus Odyssella thessalonicensis TaxID=84647 RepID=UPI000225A9C7|nr:FtsX-like permease family protein [Candidatus Odyssella thessalonicensis]
MVNKADIEEVPIAKDPITRLVPWIISLLVLLLCLVLTAASSIGTSVQRWQVGMSHRVNIEIPLQHEVDRDRVTGAVSQYLSATPGISRIEIADKTKLYSLFGVSPQQAALYPDFPLPVIIEANLDPEAITGVGDIVAQLQQVSPGVRIETYSQWHDMLLLLRQTLQVIGYIFIMLIAFTVIIMITLITRAGLASHQENISILRLIGASNGYIANKFQNHAFRLSARGAITGFALALPISWILNLASVYLGIPEMLRPQVDPVLMLGMVIIPLFVVLLSVCVSRFAVLRTLNCD